MASSYKAEEYRNLILFYHRSFEQSTCAEAILGLWRLLSFLLRSFTIPEEEFEAFDRSALMKQSHDWVKAFQTLFSKANCTYNVHQVLSRD